MSHTKEPLSIGPEVRSVDIPGFAINCQKSAPHQLDPLYAIAFSEEYARRIVACVNACAGIKTEDLEAMRGTSILAKANASCDTVQKQRNELLEALELVVKCCDEPRGRDNSEHDGMTALEAARAAIASVKGGAA